MLLPFRKPKYLYKYMPSDGAQKLFESETPSLWFSLSYRLNDIFDMRPAGSYLDGFSSVAVLCLSETPVSAAMWSHYATSKTGNLNCDGVVLEFSTEAEFFKKLPPNKVHYKSKRPTINNVYKALTTKNLEWSYEREWRCFTTPWDVEDENTKLISSGIVQVPFPFEALTAIIHGHDSQVNTGSFLERPENKHVRELICRPDPWHFRFNLRTLNDISHIKENRDVQIWAQRQRKR